MARPTASPTPRLRQQGAMRAGGTRVLPEEVAVALTFNGGTQAVMMASPADLEDFGIGFAITERIVAEAGEIEAIEIVDLDEGVDVQMRLSGERGEALAARRRRMAGPVGCGLCGIESIGEALRDLPTLGTVATVMTPTDIRASVAELERRQPLREATRAVHAAGFYVPGRGIVAVREDVGRHNALDKLTGALARAGETVSAGAFVITSRVSVDMVQKAAIAGAPVLIAVSAPTTLAARAAEAAGLTLVALARGEDFEIFSRADRISAAPGQTARNADVA